MGNFRFDMTAEGDKALGSALKIVCDIHECDGLNRHGKPMGITHYEIRQPAGPDPAYGHGNRPLRLIFFRCSPTDESTDARIALPFTLDAEGATFFARRWLEEADYGQKPDTDGFSKKGWRVYNEAWGRIEGDPTAIIAVTPSWAVYGK